MATLVVLSVFNLWNNWEFWLIKISNKLKIFIINPTLAANSTQVSIIKRPQQEVTRPKILATTCLVQTA